MGKKKASSEPHGQRPSQVDAGDIPVVGGRQPCPCGSGRRYKACHGRQAAHAMQELVRRPFEGLASECDWVAMRELVPAGTAPLTLASAYAPAEPVDVTLATVLPLAAPALRRENGEVLVGLQTQASSGDISRDVAHALHCALQAPAGAPVTVDRPGPDNPRLQDILDPAAELPVTVHDGFDFWVDDAADPSGDVKASLERANAAAIPTVRMGEDLPAAYWCDAGEKNHLRWVLPHPEEKLLDALARLHAAGEAKLGEETRFVGSFRAHGLLAPVWDLPSGMTAEQVREPALRFAGRLDEALADTAPLTPAQRRSRNGLLNRQITLS